MGGVKFHATEKHVVPHIKLAGAQYYLDTVQFEHRHMTDGVMNFRRSSRRLGAMTKEMLQPAHRYEHIEFYRPAGKYYCRCNQSS